MTRFKLIKSGKHWLRASTSQFGLFKVLRGGVDTAQVTTEVIEEQSSNTLTGLDILKGIAAAGTVLGGGGLRLLRMSMRRRLHKLLKRR